MLSWDDIKYSLNMGLYDVGLRSTPPIVMPANSVMQDPVTADPKLQQDVVNLEDTYSNTNIVSNALEGAASSVVYTWIPEFVFIAVIGFVIYLLARKAVKI